MFGEVNWMHAGIDDCSFNCIAMVAHLSAFYLCNQLIEIRMMWGLEAKGTARAYALLDRPSNQFSDFAVADIKVKQRRAKADDLLSMPA